MRYTREDVAAALGVSQAALEVLVKQVGLPWTYQLVTKTKKCYTYSKAQVIALSEELDSYKENPEPEIVTRNEAQQNFQKAVGGIHGGF
jgi:hypothetical protein